MFYYILNIKMTSQSLSNFTKLLTWGLELYTKYLQWYWRHFYVQNVTEQ